MYTYYLRDDLEILTVEETSSEVVYTVAGESVRSADIEDDFDVQIIINKSHPPRVSQIIETSIDDPNSDNVVFTFRNMGNTTVERPNALPEITFTEVIWNFEELVENHVF